MKRTPAHFALALALSFVAPPILAQTTPAPSSTDDTAMAAQKAAFMGMPEASRKAAQEALVWLGLYVGVNDGDFGKPTRDAIRAFQASLKAPADGTLSTPELKALLAAAQKAREAAGFQIVNDPKTGSKIGTPLKLLRALPGARLDFAANADADLGALYGRLSAATPSRKIAYKEIKPDAFFIVSGQDGPVKFYTRFDKNPTASPPIRGFTFVYPASRAATLDRIAIAIANSFEPFPESAAAPKASASAATNPTAPLASSAGPPPAVPQPGATAPIRQAQAPTTRKGGGDSGGSSRAPANGGSGGVHGGGFHGGGWHGGGWTKGGGWAGPAIVGGLAAGALAGGAYYGGYGYGGCQYAPIYDAYGNYLGQQPVNGCYDHSEGGGAAANQGKPRPTAAPAAREPPAAKEAPTPLQPPLAIEPNPILPEFPWPPPKASASYVLPEELFPPDNTTGRVVKRIIFALEQNGYVERSFFRTQVGGTAMVTRLERVNEDGSSYSGEGRWPASPSTDGLDTTRSLIDILRGLFFVDRGHYRVIVFILQEPSFAQSTQKISEGEARALLYTGTNVLPPEISARPYGESRCTVLIYEFASDGAQVQLVESHLTGRDHLQRAGVLSLLQSSK
jgi:hypothetical protein